MQKSLSDETRVRILMMIYHHELCLCHLMCIFDLANSTVSKHLDILKRAGLINKRKQARYHYFFFNDKFKKHVSSIVDILKDD